MIRSSHWLLWKVVLWAALAALLGARLVGAEIVPVSVALAPSAEPAGGSELASLSTAGRYVAFYSTAANLVADDTNTLRDAFVYDLQAGTVTRVSVSSEGAEANGESWDCAVSGDGRYAAFESWADNLVPDDTNWDKDIFVRDLQESTTTRASVASDGAEANGRSIRASISADGRYVAFASWASNLVPDDTNGQPDIFVHDRQTGATVRASVASDGTEGNGYAYQSRISSDGRHVAFASTASNLVANDTNGCDDVFVRDLDLGTTVRVSVANDEAQANSYSQSPDLSADGRFVAFASWASNLILPAEDTNGTADVFVRDLVDGTTVRVSVGIGSVEDQGPYDSDYPAISDDGRYVAFQSAWDFVGGHPEHGTGIFVRDRVAGTTIEASLASDESEGVGTNTGMAAISGDGTRVAFHSDERWLVPGDTNASFDVFVRDLPAGTLERCPDVAAEPPPEALALGDGPSGTGFQDPTPVSIAEGRIAFTSFAANLVADDGNQRADVFVRDLESGATVRASLSSAGAEPNADVDQAALSGNGRFVAFESAATNLVADDANSEVTDVFVRDLELETTEIVSLSTDGTQAWDDAHQPSISADGRWVAFASESGSLTANDWNGQQDVFVRDRQTPTTILVSARPDGYSGNITSWSPEISADGRWVAFVSYAHDLVTGDADRNAASDVFLRDLQSATTIRVSTDAPTTSVYGQAEAPSLSADGRYVAFQTDGSWLVPDDTNGLVDVFVFDRVSSLTERVSVHSSGAEAHGYSRYPSISADGRYVTFQSDAQDLVDGLTPCLSHVFVHDRLLHTTRAVSVGIPVTESAASIQPAISPDGLRIAFVSTEARLVAGDVNGLADIFRWSEAVAVDTFEDGTLCSWDVVVGGPPCP